MKIPKDVKAALDRLQRILQSCDNSSDLQEAMVLLDHVGRFVVDADSLESVLSLESFRLVLLQLVLFSLHRLRDYGGEEDSKILDFCSQVSECTKLCLSFESPFGDLPMEVLMLATSLLRVQTLQCCGQLLAESTGAARQLHRPAPASAAVDTAEPPAPTERSDAQAASAQTSASADVQSATFQLAARFRMCAQLLSAVTYPLVVWMLWPRERLVNIWGQHQGRNRATRRKDQSIRTYCQHLAAAMRDSYALEHLARAELALAELKAAAESGGEELVFPCHCDPRHAHEAVKDVTFRVLWIGHMLDLHACAHHPMEPARNAVSAVLSGQGVRYLVLARAVASLSMADGGPSYGMPVALVRQLCITGWDINGTYPLDVWHHRSGSSYIADKISMSLAFMLMRADLPPPFSTRVALELLLRAGRFKVAIMKAQQALLQNGLEADEGGSARDVVGAGELAGDPHSVSRKSCLSQAVHEQMPVAEQLQLPTADELQVQLRPEGTTAVAAADTNSGHSPDGYSQIAAKEVCSQEQQERERQALEREAQEREALTLQAEGSTVMSLLVKAATAHLPFISGSRRAAAAAAVWRLIIDMLRAESFEVHFPIFVEDVAAAVKGALTERPPETFGRIHGAQPTTVTFWPAAGEAAAVQPVPPTMAIAALESGLLPCIERLVRRVGRTREIGVQDLLLEELITGGDSVLFPLFVYGNCRQAAALLSSLTKLLKLKSRVLQVEEDGSVSVALCFSSTQHHVRDILSACLRAAASAAVAAGAATAAASAATRLTEDPANAPAAAAAAAATGQLGARTAAESSAAVAALQRVAMLASCASRLWGPDCYIPRIRDGTAGAALRHHLTKPMDFPKAVSETMNSIRLYSTSDEHLAAAGAGPMTRGSDDDGGGGVDGAATAGAREEAEGTGVSCSGGVAAARAGSSSSGCAGGAGGADGDALQGQGPGRPAAGADQISWRLDVLRQMRSLSWLGQWLRVLVDPEWRRQLQLHDEPDVLDLELLAECMCRVARDLSEEVRAAAAEGAAVLQFVRTTGQGPQDRDRMSRRGRGGRGGRGVVDRRETDAGAVPVTFWPPELVRGVGERLEAQGRRVAAVAMEALTAQLEIWCGWRGQAEGEAAGPLWEVMLPTAAAGAELGLARRYLVSGAEAYAFLRTCGNPECVNLEGDSEADLPLMTCARCGTVSYCCRGCQVAHWRAAHQAGCGGRALR